MIALGGMPKRLGRIAKVGALPGWVPKAARIGSATAATAIVEFALIGSFMSVLATGMAAYSILIWQQSRVQNAAAAGAAYASLHGYNATNIQSAGQSATSLGTAVSISSSQSCGCASSSGITTATCGSTCSGLGNATAGTYVTVTATYTYTPPLLVAGLSSRSLTATVVARTN